jgi:hypothetical protein
MLMALDSSGVRAALRVLGVVREQINAERTRAAGALTALVRTIDPGVDTRAPLSKTQIAAIANWRTRPEDLARATARTQAVRLARRISICSPCRASVRSTPRSS